MINKISKFNSSNSNSSQNNSTNSKLYKTLSHELSEKRFKFNYNGFESYRLWILDGKIKYIYFKFIVGKTSNGNTKYKTFKLEVDYDIYEKYIFENIFNENNENDKYIEHIFKKISNLKIGFIQQKVKNGYGPIYRNVNYFSFCGVNFNKTKNFSLELLRKYHDNAF